jgi:tetratricopeptide (TPR) repeat protein
MSYDLFISYSSNDNERGQVVALKAEIESSFRAFAGREIQVFFAPYEIQGMDDWRQRIQRTLRESHLFLAVLSPDYIASPYCQWEWEDYVRYEAMRQCLGEGVAPVFFVTLPDAASTQLEPAIMRWINEINQRHTFNLRPWREYGEKALQEAHVRSTLEQLHASLRERLSRAERARLSPNKLMNHNAAFVGRIRELTELRNVLSKNKLGVVGVRQGETIGPVAVQGLGGMGKTELALAYAHAFAWDYPGGRYQIPCENTADLRLALTWLTGQMHFEFTEEEKKDLSLQFERVLYEIQRRERCLLILDNVSDPHLLEPIYLDRLPRDGHVDLIATTRLAPASIPGSPHGLTFIAVDELPEEDALALIRSHQPEERFASQEEDDEARRIVQLLRGFTLAVETAAIYLGRHPAPDACRTFRERLSPDLLRESERAATDPAVAVRHRIRSLDETLAFTLSTLTPEAMHLLTFAALLPADQVAVPWLRILGAERYPAFQDGESNAFDQPLELLLGLRLFQTGNAVDEDGHLLIVRAHRLVQDLIRQKTAADDMTAMLQAVDGLIQERDDALNSTIQRAKASWELEPFTALATLWDKTNHPGASWLLDVTGRHWRNLAEWGRCEPLIRRALEIAELENGPDHPAVALVLNNLANLLQDTNRPAEAEALFRRAWKIAERSFGPDHPNVATCINDLAQLLREMNRIVEAESLMRRALEIDEQSFGPEGLRVARDLGNLAVLLQSTNRLAEAEPLLRHALEIDERSYGPDHPDVAIRLNNLAQLLEATNRPDEAEPMMRRTVTINELSYGPNHPQVATSIGNLAGLLWTTNRLDEAEPLMRRAAEVDQLRYGPDNPKVANSLNNLALLLRDRNQLVEAELLLRRALEIVERGLGSGHPYAASSLNNLALVLEDMNRLDEAEPLMRHALAVSERGLGFDHPGVATSLDNLAELLRATNRLDEAEPLSRRALEIDERSFGPDHPDVARDLMSLGQLLYLKNRMAEAEPLMRRALEILERNQRANHTNLTIALSGLALLLKDTNRPVEAEPLMRRALTICEQSFGPDDPKVATCLNNLASLFQATNRLAEAKPLMRRMVKIFLKFSRANDDPHPHMLDALNSYGGLLKAMGRTENQILATLRKMAPEEFE